MSRQAVRVLVVDDEVGILRIARMGLERQGYIVQTASGGVEALEILSRDQTDVVVLDLVMPDLTGQQVFRRLRERTDIPVLFNSGYRGADALGELLDGPRVAFLQKPWTISQLRSALQELLQS